MKEPDFALPFHHSSKDHAKGHPPISKDASEWPEEWRTRHYKTYPRFTQFPLPDPALHADLFGSIRARISAHDFAKEPIDIDTLGALLRNSCGIIDGKWRRAHPSGGARYPIETYLLNIRPSAALPSGLYHYDVRMHALTQLWQRDFTEEDITKLFKYDWVKHAGAAILLSATFARTMGKYGERGYRYIMLEAGHIGQNVSLVAAGLGLKCCALGGTNDEALERLLDIDGTTESIVYGIAIGK